jgi:hypothetical protein
MLSLEHYIMNAMGAEVELNGIEDKIEIMNNNKRL